MLKIVSSNQFKRDLKLLAKRKYDLALMNKIVDKLVRQEPLEEKN